MGVGVGVVDKIAGSPRYPGKSDFAVRRCVTPDREHVVKSVKIMMSSWQGKGQCRERKIRQTTKGKLHKKKKKVLLLPHCKTLTVPRGAFALTGWR